MYIPDWLALRSRGERSVFGGCAPKDAGKQVEGEEAIDEPVADLRDEPGGLAGWWIRWAALDIREVWVTTWKFFYLNLGFALLYLSNDSQDEYFCSHHRRSLGRLAIEI